MFFIKGFGKYSLKSEKKCIFRPKKKCISSAFKKRQKVFKNLQTFGVFKNETLKNYVSRDYRNCRSRKALSNEYLVAKIVLDTAENEPLKV